MIPLELPETLPLPLRRNDNGVVLVGKTRVPLDTVILAYKQGATIEAIVHSFASLAPADVYAVLSYYLSYRDEVETYLAERGRQAEQIRHEIEARNPNDNLRKRLLARKAERERNI